MSYKGRPFKKLPMQSQGDLTSISLAERIKDFSFKSWNKLTAPQKALAKKGWGIITYKWRWQIALNIPYLLIFALDRTVPAVHTFNMSIISSVVSKIPLPSFLLSALGIS